MEITSSNLFFYPNAVAPGSTRLSPPQEQRLAEHTQIANRDQICGISILTPLKTSDTLHPT
jgi:hypothetical protein